jgi:hypothetical protein
MVDTLYSTFMTSSRFVQKYLADETGLMRKFQREIICRRTMILEAFSSSRLVVASNLLFALFFDIRNSILPDRNLSLIKMLLDRGADSSMINIPWGNDGRTPLRTLRYRYNQYWPNLTAIQLILDYGGYNGIKCRDGPPPFEMAARSGFQEFIELLRVYDEKLPPKDEI